MFYVTFDALSGYIGTATSEERHEMDNSQPPKKGMKWIIVLSDIRLQDAKPHQPVV